MNGKVIPSTIVTLETTRRPKDSGALQKASIKLPSKPQVSDHLGMSRV